MFDGNIFASFSEYIRKFSRADSLSSVTTWQYSIQFSWIDAVSAEISALQAKYCGNRSWLLHLRKTTHGKQCSSQSIATLGKQYPSQSIATLFLLTRFDFSSNNVYAFFSSLPKSILALTPKLVQYQLTSFKCVKNKLKYLQLLEYIN